MRACLIDGMNLFVIHFTANPSLDSNGIPIGGVVGTLNAVKHCLMTLKPDRVYFVWDGAGGSLKKRKLNKDYKHGRKPIAGRHYQFENEDKLLENKSYQISVLKKFLDALPVCQITTQDYEADDAIGYIVSNSDYFGHKSNILVTCDKDYYQLINSKTVIYNPMSKKILDKQAILDEHGIHPKHWLFFKSINGDPSDNVKGVKGFGPKTIAKMFPVSDEEAVLTPETIERFEFEDEKIKSKQSLLVEQLETINKNWQLMDISEPLMSIAEKDKLTAQVQKFKPTLEKKTFYIETMRLGSNGISNQYLSSFMSLLRK